MSSSSNSTIIHFIKEAEQLRIPFQDIKEATKNFTTLIGKGGYGLVYKGELLLSGVLTFVAVKRLDGNNNSGQGLKEFLTEIHLLSRYKHPNVVSLLGFCEGHNEKILIYDYAQRGSLDRYITMGNSTLPLTWMQRIKICVDAARGLDYLHNHVAQNLRVIHRDIKSANVLLGQDWKAMIADFGLSKIGRANENETFIITNASGTYGYCDPAYRDTGILTKESDVYSFGVVLFEVLCGRLGFINVNSEHRFLATLAQRYYEKGRLNEIIDPYLKIEVDIDSLNMFSEIAYQCLLNDRQQRPSIGLVVQKLEEMMTRTHAIRRTHENTDRSLEASSVILNRFNLSREAEAKILRGPQENLQGYFEAIEQLKSNIQFFSNNKSFQSSNGVISHAKKLLSKAISELDLEHEFKQLLSSYSKPVEPERLYEGLPSSLRPSSGSPDASNKNPSNSHTDHTTAEYIPPVLIPPRVLPLLHNIAQHMVNAGHTQQCLIIYRDTRSQVLQESLHQLGVEKLSKNDVQKMHWEVLELKVGTWIYFMRIAVNLLLAAERKVCDQMFEGIESLKDQCFAEVTKGSVDMLLSFGDAIVKSEASTEKLFLLLDMYEIMRELHSEIEIIFRGQACKGIREAALGLTQNLAQTIKDTLGGFEEAVQNDDATRISVADLGSVHPLTSYVINIVKFFLDYQSTLKQIFQELEEGEDLNSQLASVIMRIMQALQTNLEGKSKQYKDPALTNLFIMNNIHHMVRSVRRSEAKDLLGDEWVQQHRRIVQQHANQYKRIAWVKILQSLSIQGEGLSGGDVGNSSGASRALVKDRLSIFNLQFKKLHQTQSKWTVPDPELRESLRLAIAEVLLPAYEAFIRQFGSLVENGKNRHKYIRYSSEDLDRLLGEFFEGKP